VIPVSGLLVLLTFAIQSPADQVWVRGVATVFGLLLILLVLSSFNVTLFANARSGSWRERTPKVFIEITRLVLIIIGLAYAVGGFIHQPESSVVNFRSMRARCGGPAGWRLGAGVPTR